MLTLPMVSRSMRQRQADETDSEEFADTHQEHEAVQSPCCTPLPLPPPSYGISCSCFGQDAKGAAYADECAGPSAANQAAGDAPCLEDGGVASQEEVVVVEVDQLQLEQADNVSDGHEADSASTAALPLTKNQKKKLKKKLKKGAAAQGPLQESLAPVCSHPPEPPL